MMLLRSRPPRLSPLCCFFTMGLPLGAGSMFDVKCAPMQCLVLAFDIVIVRQKKSVYGRWEHTVPYNQRDTVPRCLKGTVRVL